MQRLLPKLATPSSGETEGDDFSETPRIPQSSFHPARKSRVKGACQACQRKKRKCDGKQPICGPCSSEHLRTSNEPCIYSKGLQERYDDLQLEVEKLNQTITRLEEENRTLRNPSRASQDGSASLQMPYGAAQMQWMPQLPDDLLMPQQRLLDGLGNLTDGLGHLPTVLGQLPDAIGHIPEALTHLPDGLGHFFQDLRQSTEGGRNSAEEASHGNDWYNFSGLWPGQSNGSGGNVAGGGGSNENKQQSADHDEVNMNMPPHHQYNQMYGMSNSLAGHGARASNMQHDGVSDHITRAQSDPTGRTR